MKSYSILIPLIFLALLLAACGGGADVTIADDTILAPSEEFVKTWEFQNTGSCDWTD